MLKILFIHKMNQHFGANVNLNFSLNPFQLDYCFKEVCRQSAFTRYITIYMAR